MQSIFPLLLTSFDPMTSEEKRAVCEFRKEADLFYHVSRLREALMESELGRTDLRTSAERTYRFASQVLGSFV